MKDATAKGSARNTAIRPKQGSRIGAATLTPPNLPAARPPRPISAATSKCTRCNCALAKDAATHGQAVLKGGALLCNACAEPPVRKRNVAGVVIIAITVALALLIGGLLWNQHATREAQLTALKSDEDAIARAVDENRYLDAKAACSAVASSYQKQFAGSVPSDIAARLESLRGRYEQWLTAHYGTLDASGINTVEQILQVLPGTTPANQPRLLSFSLEHGNMKLSAVSSPRPPLHENDPQPGTSLYRDPVLNEGNGLIAFLFQNDPSIESVELEWNEPLDGGGVRVVKNFSVTRAQLPELVRSSAPLAGSRAMLAGNRAEQGKR